MADILSDEQINNIAETHSYGSLGLAADGQ